MLIVVDVRHLLRNLVEVVIGADAVLVGDLREQLDVLEIGPADIDVEEDDEAVLFLLVDQIPELGFDGQQGFRQTLAGHDADHRQIDRRQAGPARSSMNSRSMRWPLVGR